ENPRAVRAALDAELNKSGLRGGRIVAIDIDAPPPRLVRRPRPAADARRPGDSGGVLFVAAAATATAAIWLIWCMLSAVLE
ncbi:MAG: hypothetical protein ACRDQZ_21830, partial [Mycobacteriales bacterium]